MKKKDVYKIRRIVQEIKSLDDNDRDPMQKDKKRNLFIEVLAILNEEIDKKKPL